MRKLIAMMCTAIVALTSIAPVRANADTTTCPLGYQVVFFNGVGNTFGDALASMHATQAAIRETQTTSGDAYDSQDVAYEVAYNTTAAQAANVFDPVNTTILQDIAEVFVQRARELDPSGDVGDNFFYMFWEWLDGPPQNYSNALSNNAATNNFFTRFVNAAVTAAAGALGRLQGSQAPTAADYAQQEAQLTIDAANGRRLLFVGHSQGNLFMNHAYDYILPVVGAPRVKVVHVAPATVIVHGADVLSSKDIVINGLRAVNGFASIVDVNINPPYYARDPSGHGYSEIYLNADLVDAVSNKTDRAVLQDDFVAALQALDAKQCTIGLSPASSNITPAGTVTLTAALTPPANPANLLAITYKWTITGTAGGTFTNPVVGNSVTTLTTTQPTVTYNGSSTATEGQSDNVTVEMDISTANNANATTAALADNTASPAVITIGGSATLAPSNPTVTANSNTSFTVSTPDGLPAGVSYQWSLSGSGSIGQGSPVTTSVPSISYTAPAGGATATLSVSIVNAANAVIAKGSTAITTQGTTTTQISPTNPQVPQNTTQLFTVSAGSSFPSGTTFTWVLTGGSDLFGDPRNLGGSGGGTIGVNISPPPSSGAATATSVTVTTTTPSITFAANPFGPESYGPDYYWIDYLTLTVTIHSASGAQIGTATTLIGTQTPTDILLP